MSDDGSIPLEPATRDTALGWRAAGRLWHVQAIYIVALAAFVMLALLAHFYTYFTWDLAATHALQTLPVPGLSAFMYIVSAFGDGWVPYAMIAATTIAFLAFGRRSEAVGLLLAAQGGRLINRLLKLLVARPRPTPDLITVFRLNHNPSFPSEHVTFYVCYFGFVLFVADTILPRNSIVHRLVLVGTALPVALIGLSRVYLGEHWLSDTLGAYLFGGVWLALSLEVYRRLKRLARPRPEPQTIGDQTKNQSEERSAH